MAEITILDGGMGKELRRIGAPFGQPEWSALALLEAPDFVGTAHRNFIDAGADVIITNTYGVVPYHLGRERFSERGLELAELAAKIARSEADGASREVRVGGSLPPLFGSYEPERFDPTSAPHLWQILIDAQSRYVDLWIGETLSSVEEFEALMALLGAGPARGDERPTVWAAFSLADRLHDGRPVLRSGESMDALWASVVAVRSGDNSDLEAVLFNCSQPEVISEAVRELASMEGFTASGVKLGAYGNAFLAAVVEDEGYASNAVVNERRPDLSTERYADLVGDWVESGATIVGGCCDIYSEDIAELARRFGS